MDDRPTEKILYEYDHEETAAVHFSGRTGARASPLVGRPAPLQGRSLAMSPRMARWVPKLPPGTPTHVHVRHKAHQSTTVTISPCTAARDTRDQGKKVRAHADEKDRP